MKIVSATGPDLPILKCYFSAGYNFREGRSGHLADTIFIIIVRWQHLPSRFKFLVNQIDYVPMYRLGWTDKDCGCSVILGPFACSMNSIVSWRPRGGMRQYDKVQDVISKSASTRGGH